MATLRANGTLDEDKEALLEIREALAGTASLNWSALLPIADWEGVTVSDNRVKRIFLRDSRLTGSIPPRLGKLSSLEELVLDDNKLSGVIPGELGSLSCLRSLWLKNNLLAGSIPAELGNLSNLQELTLLNNRLTGNIPASLGNLSNLRELWLGMNQLSGSIPPELGNLSSLQELWLRHNQLTGSVPIEIQNLPNLRRLELAYNRLTGVGPSRSANSTKERKEKLCQDIDQARESTRSTRRKRRRKKDRYQEEYSPKWEAGDIGATEFYVYILKLEGGVFYVGHTRELRERLMEHRDGDTKSTAGKNPKLVWFGTVQTRDEATRLEVELKRICDKNPRELRRRVRHFQDLVEQLDFG